MKDLNQISWLTEVDEYDEALRLSPKSIQVAREELRETTSSRNQALEAFRNWIVKNPRIENCRLDATFLLRFLRTKKMSLPLAQESLQRRLLERAQTDIINLRNLDCNSKEFQELINSGYLLPVQKRDSLGRRIIIANPGRLNPKKHTPLDIVRQHELMCETITENEEDQVNGVVYFVSCAGLTFSHTTLVTPREAFLGVKDAERSIPMRHKMFIVFDVHPGIKFFLDFVISLLSQKLQRRVKIFSKLEDTYSVIDKKLLPKEYGGEIAKDEMIRLWKEEMQQRREMVLLNDQSKVNLSLFSEKEKQDAILSNDQTFNPEGAGFGISGSFRSLEVD